ncbi:5'-AMP-activated protein kinase subunit beta-2 [Batrachochytrium dendrobatidis]
MPSSISTAVDDSVEQPSIPSQTDLPSHQHSHAPTIATKTTGSNSPTPSHESNGTFLHCSAPPQLQSILNGAGDCLEPVVTSSISNPVVQTTNPTSSVSSSPVPLASFLSSSESSLSTIGDDHPLPTSGGLVGDDWPLNSNLAHMDVFHNSVSDVDPFFAHADTYSAVLTNHPTAKIQPLNNGLYLDSLLDVAINTPLGSDSDNDSSTGHLSSNDSSLDNESNDSMEDGELRSSMIVPSAGMPEPGTYVTVFDYMPAKPNELAVKLGDIINVHLTFHDGWCLGENHQTGIAGMVPLYSLVKLAPELERELLEKLAQSQAVTKAADTSEKSTIEECLEPICVSKVSRGSVEDTLTELSSPNHILDLDHSDISTYVVTMGDLRRVSIQYIPHSLEFRGWEFPKSNSSKATTLFFVWRFPAEKVGISGTFNNWKRQIPMFYDHGSKMYTAFVEGDHLSHGDICEYKYFVDEKWTCDDDLPIVVDDTGLQNNFLVVCTQFAYGKEIIIDVPCIQYVEQQSIYFHTLEKTESWQEPLYFSINTDSILAVTTQFVQSVKELQTVHVDPVTTPLGYDVPTTSKLRCMDLDDTSHDYVNGLVDASVPIKEIIASSVLLETVSTTYHKTAVPHHTPALFSTTFDDSLTNLKGFDTNGLGNHKVLTSYQNETDKFLPFQVTDISTVHLISHPRSVVSQVSMLDNKTDSAVFINNHRRDTASSLSPISLKQLREFSLLELDPVASRKFVQDVWDHAEFISALLENKQSAGQSDILDDTLSVYYSANGSSVNGEERRDLHDQTGSIEADLDGSFSQTFFLEWSTTAEWLTGGTVAFDGFPMIRITLLWIIYIQVCLILWRAVYVFADVVLHILMPLAVMGATVVSAALFLMDMNDDDFLPMIWTASYHFALQACLYMALAFLVLMVDRQWNCLSTLYPLSLLVSSNNMDEA